MAILALLILGVFIISGYNPDGLLSVTGYAKIIKEKMLRGRESPITRMWASRGRQGQIEVTHRHYAFHDAEKYKIIHTE